jgi:hypothetical protein
MADDSPSSCKLNARFGISGHVEASHEKFGHVIAPSQPTNFLMIAGDFRYLLLIQM